MHSNQWKKRGKSIAANWWCSLLLLPFVIYLLHQAYIALNYNIFFSISYNFPFPINLINLFIVNFLLTIHEAGHTFFSIFGWRTLTVLGGSLLEVLLPVVILLFYWRKHKKIGIQLSAFLTGCSLLHVAYYVADARKRQLPLLSGLPKSAHDWHNLLTGWNALAWDDTIAFILVVTASALFIFALMLPAWFQSYRTVNIELEL